MTLLSATLICTNGEAQSFNKTINKDSLLQVVLKDLPKEKKDTILRAYNEGSDDYKELILMMLSMPRSSKKELISNVDSNYQKINYLKTEYAKLVPVNYTVSIEFNPGDKLVNTGESIDLCITHTKNKATQTFQDWNLEYNSDKLDKMIKMINWNPKTLKIIAKLLADAHCVSIENGDPTTIGFARSGMGKYSYLLFDKPLTTDQITKYNNGCTYIFFKENIVLEYGGGAVGPQCFPD